MHYLFFDITFFVLQIFYIINIHLTCKNITHNFIGFSSLEYFDIDLI